VDEAVLGQLAVRSQHRQAVHAEDALGLADGRQARPRAPAPRGDLVQTQWRTTAVRLVARLRSLAGHERADLF
jgi:hypothetical protein